MMSMNWVAREQDQGDPAARVGGFRRHERLPPRVVARQYGRTRGAAVDNARERVRISGRRIYCGRHGADRSHREARSLGVVALALGVTGCSAVYNTVTSPGTRPARVAGALRAVRRGRGRAHALRALRASAGRAIVLVGGFLEPSDTWDAVARRLAAHHRVFAMDLAGFGYSERSGKYRLADWQRQLDAFMRALGIERALLAGHSLGAGVIAAQALAHPARTSGIVLVDGDALRERRRAWLLRDLIVDPYRTSAVQDRQGLGLGDARDHPRGLLARSGAHRRRRARALAPARSRWTAPRHALAQMISRRHPGPQDRRPRPRARAGRRRLRAARQRGAGRERPARREACCMRAITIIPGAGPPLADHPPRGRRSRDRARGERMEVASAAMAALVRRSSWTGPRRLPAARASPPERRSSSPTSSSTAGWAHSTGCARAEPISWVPALGGWLVTSHALARELLSRRDDFTVWAEPNLVRASLGVMMLSSDGGEHARQRQPFERAVRRAAGARALRGAGARGAWTRC